MKKIFDKKIIITVIISGIVFTSIGICAVNVYKSDDIFYKPNDASWEVDNVSEAINSLHDMINHDYNAGYEDAKAAASIKYIYHTHSDSCYTTKTDEVVWSGGKNYSNERTCDVCKQTHGHLRYVDGVRLASGKTYNSISQCPSCGQYRYFSDTWCNEGTGTKFSMGTYKTLACNKDENTFEKAIIVYE